MNATINFKIDSKLKKDLKDKIADIPDFPKSFRKSLVVHNEDYRELILNLML